MFCYLTPSSFMRHILISICPDLSSFYSPPAVYMTYVRIVARHMTSIEGLGNLHPLSPVSHQTRGSSYTDNTTTHQATRSLQKLLYDTGDVRTNEISHVCICQAVNPEPSFQYDHIRCMYAPEALIATSPRLRKHHLKALLSHRSSCSQHYDKHQGTFLQDQMYSSSSWGFHGTDITDMFVERRAVHHCNSTLSYSHGHLNLEVMMTQMPPAVS